MTCICCLVYAGVRQFTAATTSSTLQRWDAYSTAAAAGLQSDGLEASSQLSDDAAAASTPASSHQDPASSGHSPSGSSARSSDLEGRRESSTSTSTSSMSMDTEELQLELRKVVAPLLNRSNRRHRWQPSRAPAPPPQSELHKRLQAAGNMEELSDLVSKTSRGLGCVQSCACDG